MVHPLFLCSSSSPVLHVPLPRALGRAIDAGQVEGQDDVEAEVRNADIGPDHLKNAVKSKAFHS